MPQKKSVKRASKRRSMKNKSLRKKSFKRKSLKRKPLKRKSMKKTKRVKRTKKSSITMRGGASEEQVQAKMNMLRTHEITDIDDITPYRFIAVIS